MENKSEYQKIYEILTQEISSQKENKGRIYKEEIENLKKLKIRYNELLQPYKKAIERKEALEKLIIEGCLIQTNVEGMITDLRLTNQDIDDRYPILERVEESIEHSENLIRKMEEETESKLFNYWTIFKNLDDSVISWSEIREAFRGQIF